MKVQSEVISTTEEVKVVTLVEKKTLHISIEVDQEFLDFLNAVGRTTDKSVRDLGATPAQVKAVYPFYRAVITQLGTPEGKELVLPEGDFGYEMKK